MRGTKASLAGLFHFAGIGGAAGQHIAPVAIAAVDSTAFINFQPDTRMAERGRHAVAATVARNAAVFDNEGFWREGFGRRNHLRAVIKAPSAVQSLILQRDVKRAAIGAGRLVGIDIKCCSQRKGKNSGW
jgi:hypothetical protein